MLRKLMHGILILSLVSLFSACQQSTNQDALKEEKIEYITKPFEVNKRNIVLLENEEGKITLVGESMDLSARVVLKLDGKYQSVGQYFPFEISVISDAGERASMSYNDAYTATGKDDTYLVFYSSVDGDDIKRIDFSLNVNPYTLDRTTFSKIESLTLEPTGEKVEIPGILKFGTHSSESIVLKNEYNTLEINRISFGSYGKQSFSVSAKVTYNEDTKVERPAILYAPSTQKLFKEEIDENFYKDISETIEIDFEIGPNKKISQNEPFVKLHLLGHTLNLKLYGDSSNDSNIQIITPKVETLQTTPLFDEKYRIGGVGSFVEKPKSITGFPDTKDKYHVDAVAFNNSYSYGIHEPYHYGIYYMFLDGNQKNFEANVSQLKPYLDDIGAEPVTLYFVGDDFIKNWSMKEKDFDGKILHKVVIQPDEPAKQISFNIEGIHNLHVFYSAGIRNEAKAMLSDVRITSN
jgi:hypothetical protein